MAATNFPRSPDLSGRPLDTALLLHRDYVAEFCNHIYQSRAEGWDDRVPIGAFLPLLQSTTSIGHVLANRVDGLQNGFDTFSKIQHAIDHLNDQTPYVQRLGEWLGPYRVERENAAGVEVVKEEEEQQSLLALSRSDSPNIRSIGSNPLSSSTAPVVRHTIKPPHAKNREVTIKIRDPQTRSELELQSSDELEDRLMRDLGRTRIHLDAIGLHASGDVRIVTASASGAWFLRNPRRWRPKNFGHGARVRFPICG
ncbi:MAG: hypothetical protein LQ348_002087 [Seirophora lacunosa]|nr:MAG: hypothetical protein LQ348_002087 [Seirophora lacunosa]